MRAPRPNSTQIPDVILDYWMADLSGAEFKVLMYIARRTYGFGKLDDNISLKQIVGGIVTRSGKRLDSGTGLNKDTVCKALATLEAKGVVLRTQRADETYGDLPNSYSLDVEIPELALDGEDSGPVSENPTPRTEKTTPPPVGKSDTGEEAENPTRGESENPTGGSRKIRPTRVGKSDTQQTDQQTVLQETATAASGRELAASSPDSLAAAPSPSALPDPERTEAAVRLVAAGFSQRDAAALAKAHPPRVVQDQLAWLDRRSATKNRLGLLRKAISENWPAPSTGEGERKEANAQAKAARQSAEETRRREIVDGLRSMYARLPTEAPEAFSAFEAHIEERKAKEALRPLIGQSPKRLEIMLAAYEQEDRRLALMVEFFGAREFPPLPEFAALLSTLKDPRHQPLERLLHAPT